jgi:hypothetical protein
VCIHSVLALERPTGGVFPALGLHALGFRAAVFPSRTLLAIVHGETGPPENSSNDDKFEQQKKLVGHVVNTHKQHTSRTL